jgi:hypothetical protein
LFNLAVFEQLSLSAQASTGVPRVFLDVTNDGISAHLSGDTSDEGLDEPFIEDVMIWRSDLSGIWGSSASEGIARTPTRFDPMCTSPAAQEVAGISMTPDPVRATGPVDTPMPLRRIVWKLRHEFVVLRTASSWWSFERAAPGLLAQRADTARVTTHWVGDERRKPRPRSLRWWGRVRGGMTPAGVLGMLGAEGQLDAYSLLWRNCQDLAGWIYERVSEGPAVGAIQKAHSLLKRPPGEVPAAALKNARLVLKAASACGGG